jgi:phage gpG-like protein
MAVRVKLPNDYYAYRTQIDNFINWIDGGGTKDLLNQVGDAAVGFVRRHIQTGVDVNGSALTPSNRSKYVGGTPLLDTGKFMGSISAVTTGAMSLFIGSNLPYARALNRGATITGNMVFRDFVPGGGKKWFRTKQVTIPERRVIGLSKEEHNAIQMAANQYVILVMAGKPTVTAFRGI